MPERPRSKGHKTSEFATSWCGNLRAAASDQLKKVQPTNQFCQMREISGCGFQTMHMSRTPALIHVKVREEAITSIAVIAGVMEKAGAVALLDNGTEVACWAAMICLAVLAECLARARISSYTMTASCQC